MKPEVGGFLAKAEESISAAKVLLRESDHGFAASRAYYGMFYAAEALLLARDRSYSSHSAVLAAFGREFVKSGLFDPKWHQALQRAFQVRQVGDYEPLEHVSEATARRTLEDAEGFIQASRNFLES